jgi:hypothetical protein
MARIKINKLPEGFELVDGKVKRTPKKKHGGSLAGDQSNYGLVATPQEFYGSTNFNDTRDNSVRHSLTRVPREDANIEAEGGETVLSDLNNNGQFGLYDIKGPRHSGGGVPMFLPEQSFIYSDTNAMKFNKSEMAEFGIESKKKKTPAAISRRYKLNPFLGEINSQYADDISTLSAELMLQKNMKNLSKLAFGQELKKKFEDGVPLASYPYLVEQGIDPIEFAATIEQTQKQEQELEYIASLPPEQQEQLLRMQEMMQQVDNPEASQSQGVPSNQGSPNQPDQEFITEDANMSDQESLTAYAKFGGEKDLRKAQEGVEVEKRQPGEGNPLPKSHEKYQAFETALDNGWKLVATKGDGGRTKYEVVKPTGKNQFEDFEEQKLQEKEIVGTGDSIPIYGDNTEELLGIYEGAGSDNIRVRRGMYSGNKRPSTQTAAGDMSWGADFSDDTSEDDFMLRWGDVAEDIPDFDYKMKKGKWVGKRPVDAQAKAYKKQWVAMQKAMQEKENEFAAENGISKPRQLFPGDRPGTGYDGMVGSNTYNIARSYLRVDKPESDEAYVDDKIVTEKNKLDIPKDRDAEWWWQDMNNKATQNSLENPLYLPNIPKIPEQRIDYVLDDWTGKANMSNAAMNSMAKNLRAFGKGKVAGSGLYAKGVQSIANGQNTTHMNDVKTMNGVGLPQANLNLKVGIENARAYKDEYDGTVTALQRYTDFKNWDKQKSTELYNKAITNRANTDNLNKLKAYMQISAGDGGTEYLEDGKPSDPNPNRLTEQQKRANSISEASNYFKDQNIDISKNPGEWIDYYIGTTNTITNNGKKRQPGYGTTNQEDNDINVKAPSVTQRGQNGKEIKPWAAFYTGAMGPNKY